MGTPKDKVKLNVGGRIFETTATTLAIAGQNSLFRAMLDENWNLHSDSAITEHFIDRDPDYFTVLLYLLRTGELHIPPMIDKKLLYREAEYYGILDHVRSAKWGPFDGNRARLAQSITDWSATDIDIAQTIRASPSGWCCVAQGSVVRVYDWMLEEHPIIHTDGNKVNDVCWVDSKNIVISSDETLANGGIGLFNASTGKSRCKFQVTNKLSGLAPFVTASTLDFSSDYKLFSSCGTSDDDHGICIWDLGTGKLIDFLCGPSVCSRKTATRLQWLHDTNCVMAVYSYPTYDVCLFDVRKNAIVWSSKNRNKDPSNVIADAIAIEDCSTVSVLNRDDGLGFMDLRSTDTSVKWRSKQDFPSHPPSSKLAFHEGQLFSSFHDRISVYPSSKLAFHEGQLFSSFHDKISVYSGSNWLPTSQLQQSQGGTIRDFSIGGGRLFALHHAENVIDVWETPRPPII